MRVSHTFSWKMFVNNIFFSWIDCVDDFDQACFGSTVLHEIEYDRYGLTLF